MTTRDAVWVLYVWAFASQAGVPVPVAPSLLAAGALAGGGSLSFTAALAAAVGAALSADLLWYSLGRWRGTGALAVLGRLWRVPATFVHRAERLFLAHQLGFLVSARFLPGLNSIAASLAGAAGLSVGRYVLIASGSALVWAGMWTSLGYLLGDVIVDAAAPVGLPVLVLLAVALAGYVILKYARPFRAAHSARVASVTTESNGLLAHSKH